MSSDETSGISISSAGGSSIVISSSAKSGISNAASISRLSDDVSSVEPGRFTQTP